MKFEYGDEVVYINDHHGDIPDDGYPLYGGKAGFIMGAIEDIDYEDDGLPYQVRWDDENKTTNWFSEQALEFAHAVIGRSRLSTIPDVPLAEILNNA